MSFLDELNEISIAFHGISAIIVLFVLLFVCCLFIYDVCKNTLSKLKRKK